MMSDKAYNKKLPHRCEYCEYGKSLEGTNEIVCKKRGITLKDDSCRKYKYNPLKRTPEEITLQGNFSAEDFSI